MGLWTKKSITVMQAEASGESTEHTLRRALGALNLTTLGIGAIIGAGIFLLTGTAAAQHAGPALVLSFIVSGVGCIAPGPAHPASPPRDGRGITRSRVGRGRARRWTDSGIEARNWSGLFATPLPITTSDGLKKLTMLASIDPIL